MNQLERIIQLRDDYRRREATTKKMKEETIAIVLQHDRSEDVVKLERLTTKESLYREFANEINRIL